MFFDDYPRFLDTSVTASGTGRLNLRHEAMIADNVDVLKGARVLDLASHDGRWSFAALKAGADHVTGVEAREHLVEHARRSFEAEGVDPDSYDLRQGDMFTAMRSGDIKVDVVMCLGFMYHTLRYNELVHGMSVTGAQHLIIDTDVLRDPKPYIMVRAEDHSKESMAAADEFTQADRTLSGLPTMAALHTMFRAYGFTMEKRFDWAALAAQHPEVPNVRAYVRGGRVTTRWTRIG